MWYVPGLEGSWDCSLDSVGNLDCLDNLDSVDNLDYLDSLDLEGN